MKKFAVITIIFIFAFIALYFFNTRSPKFAASSAQKSESTPLISSEVKKQPIISPTNKPTAIMEKTLNEILISGNDNDPRLDTDFKNLSIEEKIRLREKYSEIRMESRNSRGTVVFILAKNISSPEDLQFFQSVLREVECLSLEDCNKPYPSDSDFSHHDPYLALAYPQVLTVRMLSDLLKKTESPEIREAVQNTLRAASASPYRKVREMLH